jgi:uncharacterized protein (DUF2141 family)
LDPALGLFLSLVATTILAQQPARDRTIVPPDPTGTASITGIVVDAEPQPQPVRRAIVTLSGAEIARGRATISDDNGHFVFDDLPAGRFMVSVTKAAYLTGTYGATRPGRPGVPLQLATGQHVMDIRITLPRGAAITGALRDMTGEPAANMVVVAFRVPPPGAVQTLVTTATGSSDDRGVYRIYGLMPGTYLVATAMRLGVAQADISVMSTAEIDRVLRELQQKTGVSTAAPMPSPARDLVPPGTYAYAPAFYPGVASPVGATTLKVAAGEERAGVDFAVRYTRMATIQGTLRSPDGTVPSVQFAINTLGLRLQSLLGSTPTFSTEKTASTRAFKYTNTAPGRYAISVRTASDLLMWARAEVEVSGDDISDLELVLQPAIRLRGRVVFDGSTAPPGSLSVTLTASNGAGGGAAGTTQLGNIAVYPAAVDAEGTFELTGIIPESYRLSTTVPSASGWLLRSAVVNGWDVLDYPFEIGAANISGAVLTFTDRHTQLSGTLTTASSAVAPGYFIAVFPTDRTLWRWQSRRIQSARTGTDGRWILKDLPPGEYLIAALTDLDPEDLLDPAMLETLAPSAVKVTLADGEQKTQDMKIGGHSYVGRTDLWSARPHALAIVTLCDYHGACPGIRAIFSR